MAKISGQVSLTADRPLVQPERMNSCSRWVLRLLLFLTAATGTVFAQAFLSPRLWERSTPYSFSLGPSRTVHDGDGGLYAYFQLLDWANGQQVGSPMKLRASDGTVDSRFAPGITEFSATAVAIQPDGKVIIEGGRERCYYVARLLPNGERDAAFQPFEVTQGIRHLAILPDGGILVTVAGNTLWDPSPIAYPTPERTILKLKSDGRLDSQFESPVLLTTPFAPPVIDTDGRIYYGGSASRQGGLVRLFPDGRKDPSFPQPGAAGREWGGTIRGLALQKDGKLVIAGDIALPYPTPPDVPLADRQTNRFAALRLDAEGRVDPTFSWVQRRLLGLADYPRMMVMQPDDKFVVAAAGLHRFNADGTLDESFKRYQPPGYFNFWLSQSADGHLFTIGDAERGLVAFDLDGNPAAEFSAGGFGSTSIPESFARFGEGKVIVSGAFNRVDQVAQSLLTVLQQEDGRLARAQPKIAEILGPEIISPTYLSERVQVFEASEGMIYFTGEAGRLDEFQNVVAHPFALRLRTDGTPDPGFQVSPELLSGRSGFMADSAKKLWFYKSGPEAALAWWSRQNLSGNTSGWALLGRLGQDGKVESAFKGTPPRALSDLFNQLGSVSFTPEGNLGRIITGVFQPVSARASGGLLASLVTTNGNQRLIKLTANGQLDPAFAAPVVPGAPSFEDFPELVHPISGLTTPVFDVVLNYERSVYREAVELTGGSVLVLGDFRELGGVPVAGLARLSPTGTVENAPLPEFRLTGSPFPSDRVRLLAIAADGQGRAYVAGIFDEVNGARAQGIVRLHADGSWDRSFTCPLELVDYPSATAQLRVDGDVLWAMGTFRGRGETFPRPLWKLELAAAAEVPALQWQVGSGRQLTLSWPATVPGLVLEVSAAAAGEANWRPAGVTVVADGGVNSAVVSLTAQTEFFRLRRVPE